MFTKVFAIIAIALFFIGCVYEGNHYHPESVDNETVGYFVRSNPLPRTQVAIGDTFLIPHWEWETLASWCLQSYANGTSLTPAGETCGIVAGGKLVVKSLDSVNAIVCYQTPQGYKPLGTPCPCGAELKVPVSQLLSFDDELLTQVGLIKEKSFADLATIVNLDDSIQVSLNSKTITFDTTKVSTDQMLVWIENYRTKALEFEKTTVEQPQPIVWFQPGVIKGEGVVIIPISSNDRGFLSIAINSSFNGSILSSGFKVPPGRNGLDWVTEDGILILKKWEK